MPKYICVAVIVIWFLALFSMLPANFAASDSITLTRVYYPFGWQCADGFVFGEDANYSKARSTPTAANDWEYFFVGQNYTGTTYKVFRGYIFIDTQRIPDSATILSANLYLYVTADESDTDFIIRITKSTSPDDRISIDDYNQTDGNYYDDGGLSTANIELNAYNKISIPGTVAGSLINKTGLTKLCLVSLHDILSVEPTGKEYIAIESMYSVTAHSAYLEVTFVVSQPQIPFTPLLLIGGGKSQLVVTDFNSTFDLTEYLSYSPTLAIRDMNSLGGAVVFGFTDEPVFCPDTALRPIAPLNRLLSIDRNGKFTVIPLPTDLQVMDIEKKANSLIIGGFTRSGEGYPYGEIYPKVYICSASGVKDETLNVFRSLLPDEYAKLAVMSVADCGNYWLIGAEKSFSSERWNTTGYLYRWDTSTHTLRLLMNRTTAIPQHIVWNGRYSLITWTAWNETQGTLYKYDGNTLSYIDLTTLGYPLSTTIDTIATNGTHFLMDLHTASVIGDLYAYDGTSFTLLNDTISWSLIAWTGAYWVLGGENGEGTPVLYTLQGNTWTDYSSLITFTPSAIFPFTVRVYVTSNPEVHATFTFMSQRYTTPTYVDALPGVYPLTVIDLHKPYENQTLFFLYMDVEASPIERIYNPSASLTLTSDALVTLNYGFTLPKREVIPPPPEAQLELYCLPVAFWVILMLLLFFGVYFFSQKQTWKITFPTIPVILWLLLFEPKIPIEEMPITILRHFLVPPWHIIWALILAVAVAITLLLKQK